MRIIIQILDSILEVMRYIYAGIYLLAHSLNNSSTADLNSLGLDVDVKLYKAVDGTKEYTGKLTAYDADTLTIEMPDGNHVFNRKDAASVRLTIDF